jgi:hypothetical protein
MRVLESEVQETFVSGAWTVPLERETRDQYWGRVRDSSHRYVPFASKTYRLFRKFCGKVFVTTGVPLFREQKKFWVKEDDEGPTGPVAFSSVGSSIF